MKTLLISLSCVLATSGLYATVEKKYDAYTPKNTIIVVDLDDVVLERNKKGVFKKAIKYGGRFLKGRKLFRERKHIPGDKGQRYGEGFYVELQRQGKTKLAKALKEVCIQKSLKKDTIKELKKLRDAGFEIWCATNLGDTFFAELKRKYPEIFNNNFIKHGMTVDYTAKEIIQKPDPRYFERLKERINPHGAKTMLFIDDKPENTQAARKAGLKTITFRRAGQMKQALHQFGICLCNDRYQQADTNK